MAVVESISSQVAAWVEAIGAIAAVVGSGWVAAGESRAARLREERARRDAEHKEARAALATKTAALNLAILAATQIHDLHVLLRDDAWRGRVARVSPSRALLATESMLTSFPLQSLPDAPSMVAFSRFPAALATAAEVYANLETAVRAAHVDARGAIFTEYDKQMERLDSSVKRQLQDLSSALDLKIDSQFTGGRLDAKSAAASRGTTSRARTEDL
jgi:Skp family chaperone for outer membrane proteins